MHTCVSIWIIRRKKRGGELACQWRSERRGVWRSGEKQKVSPLLWLAALRVQKWDGDTCCCLCCCCRCCCNNNTFNTCWSAVVLFHIHIYIFFVFNFYYFFFFGRMRDCKQKSLKLKIYVRQSARNNKANKPIKRMASGRRVGSQNHHRQSQRQRSRQSNKKKNGFT